MSKDGPRENPGADTGSAAPSCSALLLFLLEASYHAGFAHGSMKYRRPEMTVSDAVRYGCSIAKSSATHPLGPWGEEDIDAMLSLLRREHDENHRSKIDSRSRTHEPEDKPVLVPRGSAAGNHEASHPELGDQPVHESRPRVLCVCGACPQPKSLPSLFRSPVQEVRGGSTQWAEADLEIVSFLAERSR